MLKFLSRVRIEFNALDPRTASCTEFLAQCNAARHREPNPAGCHLLVKRRTDDYTPKITLTYVDGAEEVVDAASTSAQALRDRILEKGRLLETEKMFREGGEKWPVLIPEEELRKPYTAVMECDRTAAVDGRCCHRWVVRGSSSRRFEPLWSTESTISLSSSRGRAERSLIHGKVSWIAFPRCSKYVDSDFRKGKLRERASECEIKIKMKYFG